jgi:hypothetical protein
VAFKTTIGLKFNKASFQINDGFKRHLRECGNGCEKVEVCVALLLFEHFVVGRDFIWGSKL